MVCILPPGSVKTGPLPEHMQEQTFAFVREQFRILEPPRNDMMVEPAGHDRQNDVSRFCGTVCTQPSELDLQQIPLRQSLPDFQDYHGPSGGTEIPAGLPGTVLWRDF